MLTWESASKQLSMMFSSTENFGDSLSSCFRVSYLQIALDYYTVMITSEMMTLSGNMQSRDSSDLTYSVRAVTTSRASAVSSYRWFSMLNLQQAHWRLSVWELPDWLFNFASQWFHLFMEVSPYFFASTSFFKLFYMYKKTIFWFINTDNWLGFFPPRRWI